jgi:hypothetical protein
MDATQGIILNAGMGPYGGSVEWIGAFEELALAQK